MVEKPGSRYRIEALAKGLDVLRLFDESVTSLKLREICDRTGIPMPTAFRVVATLEEGGFSSGCPTAASGPASPCSCSDRPRCAARASCS